MNYEKFKKLPKCTDNYLTMLRETNPEQIEGTTHADDLNFLEDINAPIDPLTGEKIILEYN